jgi:anti-sigma factor RsiW
MAESNDHHIDDDDAIARYLLGLLSDEERSAVQERLFQDEDYFDRIRAKEYELLDAYSRGEMPASERALLESSLLASAEGRRALDFARGLAAVQTRAGKRRAPYLLIAAVVVVATATGLLFTLRKDHKSVETRTAPPISAPKAQPATAPVVFSVLLTPGATRGGGEIKRLAIPPGTDLVQLQLDLEGDHHPVYAATLKTTSGTQVWEQSGLNPQSDGSILCRVPDNVFKSGSYELALTAAASGRSPEVVAYYYFQASR